MIEDIIFLSWPSFKVFYIILIKYRKKEDQKSLLSALTNVSAVILSQV